MRCLLLFFFLLLSFSSYLSLAVLACSFLLVGGRRLSDLAAVAERMGYAADRPQLKRESRNWRDPNYRPSAGRRGKKSRSNKPNLDLHQCGAEVSDSAVAAVAAHLLRRCKKHRLAQQSKGELAHLMPVSPALCESVARGCLVFEDKRFLGFRVTGNAEVTKFNHLERNKSRDAASRIWAGVFLPCDPASSARSVTAVP